MRNFVFQALILTVAGPSIVSAQSQCDFDKPTGKCVGTVSIQKSYGSKPVSARNCQCEARQLTVQRSSSTWIRPRTKQFSKTVVTTSRVCSGPSDFAKEHRRQSCTSYASVGQGRSNSSEQVQSGSFSGTWSGSIRWTFVSAGTTLSITEHGNSVSGT